MKLKAFSLIELMVVIAIVTILSAVAVPAYKDYLRRANLSNIVPAIDAYFEKMQTYFLKHGHYPLAYDLGLTSVPNSNQAAPGTSPFFTNVYIYEATLLTNSNQTCGAGVLQGDLDMSAIGFPAGTTGGFSCYIFPYHHAYQKDCFYTLYDTNSNEYIYGNLIPKWAGCTNATCSSSPYYAVKDGNATHIGFANATCDAD